jgi:biopolymer transport protein ExbD
MKLINKKKREYDDDGLLPLVNIIFLLLIFFMIAGVIEKRIINDDIDLPSVDLSKYNYKEVTRILIKKDNILSINDEVIEMSQIDNYFKTNKQNEVIVIADKSLYIKDINVLLSKLHKNKITNIKLLSNRNGN